MLDIGKDDAGKIFYEDVLCHSIFASKHFDKQTLVLCVPI